VQGEPIESDLPEPGGPVQELRRIPPQDLGDEIVLVSHQVGDAEGHERPLARVEQAGTDVEVSVSGLQDSLGGELPHDDRLALPDQPRQRARGLREGKRRARDPIEVSLAVIGGERDGGRDDDAAQKAPPEDAGDGRRVPEPRCEEPAKHRHRGEENQLEVDLVVLDQQVGYQGHREPREHVRAQRLDRGG
jgi:hypothetical protein